MDKSKNLFKCRYLLLILASVIVYLLLNHAFTIEPVLLTTINSVVFSVVASFLVGVYFQYKLKDEISQEHLRIIEHKNEFNKSGIIQYSGSFSEILEDLRLTISDSKEVTIYIAYGRTVLNNLKESINKLLNKRGTILNIYLLDKENPFISGYEKLWGYKEGKLVSLIDETKELLEDKIGELKKQDDLRGELNIYSNKKYPIHSSFYFCDDVIYFVPSKHYGSRDFVPPVIKAQRTIEKTALYNKVSKDLLEIKKSCEITTYKK